MEVGYKLFRRELVRGLHLRPTVRHRARDHRQDLKRQGIRIYEVPIAYTARVRRGQEDHVARRLRRRRRPRAVPLLLRSSPRPTRGEARMALRTTVVGSWWKLDEHEPELARYHAGELSGEDGEALLDRTAAAAIAEQRALGLDEWTGGEYFTDNFIDHMQRTLHSRDRQARRAGPVRLRRPGPLRHHGRPECARRSRLRAELRAREPAEGRRAQGDRGRAVGDHRPRRATSRRSWLRQMPCADRDRQPGSSK